LSIAAETQFTHVPMPRLTNHRTSTPPARKLAFAVFGAVAQVPLQVIHDALELKILAAQALGYRDAADALSCARRRVGLVCGRPDSPVALNTQLKDPDFDVELEAALREVHAAYARIPRSYVGALVPPTARHPDPELASDRASLARELRILLGWTGTSTYALAAHARRHRQGIGETDLRSVLVFAQLPLPAELEVILSGCGLPPQDHEPWYRARERAALTARHISDSPPGPSPVPGPAVDRGPSAALAACPEPKLPDLGDVRTRPQLRARLAALGRACGHSRERIHQLADAEGLDVAHHQLDDLLDEVFVPLPEHLLTAFLAGCGLDPIAREPWLTRYRVINGQPAPRRGRAPETVSAPAPHSEQPRTVPAFPLSAAADPNPTPTPTPGATASGAHRPARAARDAVRHPDPDAVHAASALRQALAVLAAAAGRDAARMQQLADAEGLHASREHLDGLARGRPVALPEPLLHAFLAGCGLDPVAREPWLLAYQRVYINGTRKAQVNARRWAKMAHRAATADVDAPDSAPDPSSAPARPVRESTEEQPASPQPPPPADPPEPSPSPPAPPVVIPRPRIGQRAPKSRHTASAVVAADARTRAAAERDAAVAALSSAVLDELRRGASPLIGALLDTPAPSASPAAPPPGPQEISGLSQFADRLAALVRWSGRSLVEITQEALRHDIAVTAVPLRHSLARRELPSATVLRAITVGCRLPSAQQEAWEAVRKRLAAQPLSAHRLPAAPIRPTPRV
jgi:hypothetical protein